MDVYYTETEVVDPLRLFDDDIDGEYPYYVPQHVRQQQQQEQQLCSGPAEVEACPLQTEPATDMRMTRAPTRYGNAYPYCPINYQAENVMSYNEDQPPAPPTLDFLTLRALAEAASPVSPDVMVHLQQQMWSNDCYSPQPGAATANLYQQQGANWSSSSWGLDANETRGDTYNRYRASSATVSTDWTSASGLDWTNSATTPTLTPSLASHHSPQQHGGSTLSPLAMFSPSGGRGGRSVLSDNWRASKQDDAFQVSFPDRQQASPERRTGGSNKSNGKASTSNGGKTGWNQKNLVVFRVPMTCIRQQYTREDVYSMVQLLYGRRLEFRDVTRYHLLVAQVLLFCWRALNDAKIGEAIKNRTRLTGALGFTAHRMSNSHFFSVVMDFSNAPSPEAECWPSTSLTERKTVVASRQSDGRTFASFLDRLAELTKEQDVEHWRDNVALSDVVDEDQQEEGILGAPRLISVHPSVDCNACDCAHIQEGNYWVAWKSELPELPAALSGPLELCYTEGEKPKAARQSEEAIVRQWPPFCCKKIAKMHHRRLRRDGIFQGIVAHRGSQPDIVFAVKTMKVSAGVYDERFFQLVNDEVVSVEGPFHTKIHAFKNYYCSVHQYWFSIDLFKRVDDETDWEAEAEGEKKAAAAPVIKHSDSNSSISSGGGPANPQQIHRHCMRMSPFTHLDNWVFMDHFFRTTGFPPMDYTLK